MPITVVKYPQGYVLDTTANAGVISSSTGAMVTAAGHGLNTGDFIYIYSKFSAYNGYWYVSKIDANTFRFREYATASDQPFVNSGTIAYYKSVLTHGWNSAHLPMIYKLKSDLWPINGVDTSRTVIKATNYNGYTYLQVSADIKLNVQNPSAATFENIILTGTANGITGSFDGVYKLVAWFSDTNFVINRPFSGSDVYSSCTIQYYYLNYKAKVKIYAGLVGTHTWTASKPYSLITTINVIPDLTGVMTLNVADFVKEQIEIFKNDLTQDELPNDIDSWCRCYISVAESYDDSDMYTVSEYVGTYTDDTTEVYAVNAVPQFKTRSAGALSPYVSGLTSPTVQGWLTPFTRPTIFSGKYFDMSYIMNSATGGNYVKRDLYTSARALISSNLDIQPSYDKGVYRYPLTVTGSEKTIDLTLYNVSGVQLSSTVTIDVNTDPACIDVQAMYLTWKNYLGGQDYWSFTGWKTYTIDIPQSETQQQNYYQNYPKSYGEFADTIEKQTARLSKNAVDVGSQYISQAQINALKYIVTSPLVQQVTTNTVNSQTVVTLRTVIVDPASLKVYKDRDKMYSINFRFRYTDQIMTQNL